MIKKLLLLAFCMTLAVITLGALTRLLDAGLGCPDWPGCYGQITPPSSELHIEPGYQHTDVGGVLNRSKAWMEMIHRYLASGLGLVILAIAVMVQKYACLQRKLVWSSRILIILVIVQGLFGMWTVTMKLWPQVVTLHLLGGLSVLSLLAYMLFLISKQSRVDAEVKLFYLARVCLCLLVIQLALGGWTSSTYSGLACPDFPKCQNQWLPETEFKQAFNLTELNDASYQGGQLSAQSRITIQLTHRLMALVLTFCILLLAWQLMLNQQKNKAISLLVATLFQVGLGVSNAVLLLPLSLALLHNTGAAILLLMLLWINFSLKYQFVGSKRRMFNGTEQKISL